MARSLDQVKQLNDSIQQQQIAATQEQHYFAPRF